MECKKVTPRPLVAFGPPDEKQTNGKIIEFENSINYKTAAADWVSESGFMGHHAKSRYSIIAMLCKPAKQDAVLQRTLIQESSKTCETP